MKKTKNKAISLGRVPVAPVAEADFSAAVLESNQPVLVVFWTPWSRPCRVLESILQEIAKSLEGRARVVKVNADNSLNLSLCYDIQSIPTSIYFVEGIPRLRIVGTASKEAILGKLGLFGLPRTTHLPATADLGASYRSEQKDYR